MAHTNFLRISPLIIFLVFSTFKNSGQSNLEIQNVLRLIKDGTVFHYEKKEIESAIKIYNEALSLSQNSGFKKGGILVSWYLGEAHQVMGNFNLSKEHYELSLSIASEIGDKKSEVSALGGLGRLYSLEVGDISKAIECYQKSLKINRNINNKLSENYDLFSLGYSYQLNGNYTKALEYFELALTSSRNLQNLKFEYQTLVSIGNMYSIIRDYEKATFYLNQGLKIAIKLDDPNLRIQILSAMGGLFEIQDKYSDAMGCFRYGLKLSTDLLDYRNQGVFQARIAGIYKKLGNFKQAIIYYLDAINKYKKVHDAYMESQALIGLGEVYNRDKKYSEALKYATAGINISSKFNDRHLLIWGSYAVGEANMLLGNQDQAKFYLENAADLLESTRETLPNDNLRMSYFETSDYIYDKIIELYFRLYQKSSDVDYIRKAHIFMERSRARGFLENLVQSRQGPWLLTGGVDAEYENSIHEKLLSLRKRSFIIRGSELESLLSEIIETEKELELYKSDLRMKNPLYAEVFYPSFLTLDDIVDGRVKVSQKWS